VLLVAALCILRACGPDVKAVLATGRPRTDRERCSCPGVRGAVKDGRIVGLSWLEGGREPANPGEDVVKRAGLTPSQLCAKIDHEGTVRLPDEGSIREESF
jgi:hypothetical protein